MGLAFRPSMRRALVRRAALLVLALALAACGGATRLVYEQGDSALLVMADRYLNLEGPQWKVANGSIRRFHAWHRRAELPRYAELFQSAAGRVQRGLTRDDVEWAMQSLRARYGALVEAAAREAEPLLDTLDAENVAALERRFAVNDRKDARELVSGDPAKRERARAGAIVKRLEEWTGPVSAAQNEIVRRFVQATADHPRLAHELKRRKQRELVALLDQDDGATTGPIAKRLRAFFVAWEAERHAAHREYHARFVQFMLELDRTLTPAQRAHAIERLRGYAEDARQLARGA
jgi:hypothetical protein